MQPRRNRFGTVLPGGGLMAAFSMLFAACVGQIDDSSELGASTYDVAAANGAPKDLSLATNGPRATPDPIPEGASGYLLRRGSIVDPWCAAVLVDPSTVLTAAHC